MNIRINTRLTLYLMSIPCFLIVVAFSYVPLLGWIIAFFDYKPGISIFQSTFTGLKFFRLALNEPELVPVLCNTLAISLLNLFTSPIPALFAIFLSEVHSNTLKKLVQITTTLPYFISWVLVFSLVFSFFSTDAGLVNSILINLGVRDNPINPLANPDIVWFFQTGLGLWKGLGYNAIIYFAAIAGIDQEIYDAANVDGAGRLAKIVHITVPGLYSTFVVLLVLGIGNMLSNGFDQFYIFHNPVVHDKIQVLDYYLYRIGLGDSNGGGDFSLSTALGISKTFVSLILLTIANLLSKRLRGNYII